MKHLKKFENNGNTLKLTYVSFESEDYEYVLALYIDGICWTYGDHDNDRINEFTNGIESGLQYCGKVVVSETIICENIEYNDKIINSEQRPPEKLEDLQVFINATDMGLL